MRIGELFSGYGGLGMGVQSVLGGDIAWHSEIDPGPCKILRHRYPDVPNLGDITAIDWTQVEPVDVITGGFPCQDVSSSGKRRGLHSETRSGLWAQMARAIDELRPGLVVAENVRGLLSACALSELEPCPRCLGDESQPHRPVLRALGRVLGELADLGYDARWHGLRAADVGAPHGRFRVFVVAWPAEHPTSAGLQGAAGRRVQYGVPRAGHRGLAAADTDSIGQRSNLDDVRAGQPDADRSPAADADRIGLPRRSPVDCPEPSSRRGHADGLGVEAGGVDWGIYGPAIRRWERTLGRVAPWPTERGKNGQPRLSPAFVEWMQGLPAGWVTDVPGITRNEALKALGNGVCPQQCAEALRRLLDIQEVAA